MFPSPYECPLVVQDCKVDADFRVTGLNLDSDVRAVIISFSTDISFAMLTESLEYLKDDTILFIATETDSQICPSQPSPTKTIPGLDHYIVPFLSHLPLMI